MVKYVGDRRKREFPFLRSTAQKIEIDFHKFTIGPGHIFINKSVFNYSHTAPGREMKFHGRCLLFVLVKYIRWESDSHLAARMLEHS